MLERTVDITPAALAETNDYLQRNMAELLKIPEVCAIVARHRFDPKGEITMAQPGKAVMSRTIDHNLGGLFRFDAPTRPRLLINPLLSLNSIATELPNLKVLSIGPRTEAEIFGLLSAGFRPNNLHALDLFSYSKWIDCGDMHAQPYADDSFDVVLMGWVLAYSIDRAKACAEAARVAKPGAFVAVGCQYQPYSLEQWREISGHHDYQFMFTSTQEILDLFGPAVGEVLFRSDIAPEHRQRAGDIITIFRIAK